MANTLTSFTVMRTLVRREFWEQRLLFLWAPILVTLLFTALQLIQSVRSWQALDLEYSGFQAFLSGRALDAISMTEDMYEAMRLNTMYSAGVGPHVLVFSCMMIYYCLSTLFLQNRSRSVLFFRSMPVSEGQTALSKAISGLVLAHGIYLSWALLMIVTLFAAQGLHANLAGIEFRYPLPSPEPLAERLLNGVLLSILSLFWCLPGYGWLLLCSALAKQAPLLWAAAPFVAISLPAVVLFNNTELPIAILGHFVPIFLFDWWYLDASRAMQNLGWDNLFLSVVVGLGFLFAAIKFNRTDAD